MARSLFVKLRRRFGPGLSGSDRMERTKSSILDMAQNLLTLRSTKEAKKAIPHIGIVGGGFAGLAAGYYLCKGGAKVTLLEGSPRLGGRVWTSDQIAPGRRSEAGGELIGLCHPIWLHLALKFGLGLSVLSEDDQLSGQGLSIPLELRKGLILGRKAESLYAHLEKVLQSLGKKALKVKAHEPWKSSGATRLDETSLGSWFDQWLKRKAISAEAREALEIEFSNTNGAPTGEQSLLFNLAQIKGGGGPDFWDTVEVFRCTSGNSALAQALAHEIGERGGTIRTDTPVTEITISPETGVDVQAGRDQASLHFDYAILAIPPSKWSDGLAITPHPGDEYRVTMGTAVKYLSPIGKRFWLRPEGRSPSGASVRFGMTWEGTDNQAPEPGAAFELSVFAGGETATAALNALQDPALTPAQYYGPLLRTVYPDYPSNLIPGHPPQFIGWPNDPWIRAGYSCLKPGEVTTKAKLLARPYYERLFFAGEHTSPAYYGYMEGALHSGYRVGRRILQKCGWADGPVPPSIHRQLAAL